MKDTTAVTSEVVVLMLRDFGLRSALIGHLAIAGESVVTYDGDPRDLIAARAFPTPAFLVIDDVLAKGRKAFVFDPEMWSGVILLTDRCATPPSDVRARWIALENVPDQVIATLQEWRETAG